MHARLVLLFLLGCSSAKQSAPASGNEAGVRPSDAAIDAAPPVDAALEAAVDAAIDAPAPAPHVKAKPRHAKKPCPACGIGCPNGRPSSKVDENGCPACACEDFLLKEPGL
jgi:hypothetical protein